MLKKFLMAGAVLLTLMAWPGRQVTAADPRPDDAKPVPPAATADFPRAPIRSTGRMRA